MAIMYEFFPFFTNDGSVGLYSKEDDDIYHSVYGALTESWDKFVVPSHIEDLIRDNKDIKIFDICYGIGYNTKSALQIYLNEYIKRNKKNNFQKIYIFFLKIFLILFLKLENFSKKIFSLNNNIATIDTNNNSNTSSISKIDTDNVNERQIINFSEFYKNSLNKSMNSNSAIDTDNKFDKIIYKYCKKEKINLNSKSLKLYNFILNKIYLDEPFPKIFIDAVDNDSTLLNISAIITNKLNYKKTKLRNIDSDKLKQVNKISKIRVEKPDKSKQISEIILMLIAQNLINTNHEILNENNVKNILSKRENLAFISKNMLNFIKFYSNYRYKSNLKENKSTFLHNIYYQYISRSYKLCKKLLPFNPIRINLAVNDARRHILSSNNKYNIVFLDAFTPTKCPTLWTVDFFKELYNHLEDDGILLTYSNSAAVRNALINAGFYVGKNFDKKHKKYIGTIAAKCDKLIDYKLDEKDLALINSKAGIYYKDKNLNADINHILELRQYEFENSNLPSSSQSIKGLKYETEL